MVTQIYEILSGILGAPSPEIWQPKTWNVGVISDNMRLDREFLRNATRHRQLENSFANYGCSRTGRLNLVYFGLQVAKNRTGVMTHPPAIVQRTGVNKSVAFARWRFWPTQRAAVMLGIATHLVNTILTSNLKLLFLSAAKVLDRDQINITVLHV